MTYKEAADRIEEHMRIHYNNEYPHAIKITEALELAVNVLQKTYIDRRVCNPKRDACLVR